MEIFFFSLRFQSISNGTNLKVDCHNVHTLTRIHCTFKMPKSTIAVFTFAKLKLVLKLFAIMLLLQLEVIKKKSIEIVKIYCITIIMFNKHSQRNLSRK